MKPKKIWITKINTEKLSESDYSLIMKKKLRGFFFISIYLDLKN